MTDVDREQLRRDCFGSGTGHGELMHGALRDGQDNSITWHLIQVIEKLERET